MGREGQLKEGYGHQHVHGTKRLRHRLAAIDVPGQAWVAGSPRPMGTDELPEDAPHCPFGQGYGASPPICFFCHPLMEGGRVLVGCCRWSVTRSRSAAHWPTDAASGLSLHDLWARGLVC